MKRFILLSAFAALIGLLIGSEPAVACWCGDATLQEMFDNSDAVFSGIVTSMEPGSLFEAARYELTVTACWKGVSEQGSTVVVRSPGAYWDCNWGAAVGQECVIYAEFEASTEEFYTDDCHPNGQVPLPLEHATFLGPSNCGPVAVEDETWGRIKAAYR